MCAYRNVQHRRQHRDAVLATLGLPNDQFTPLQRKVLDPKPQALHEAQSAAIEEVGHQPRRALELCQERAHVGASQHHREAPRVGGAGHFVQPRQLRLQHVATAAGSFGEATRVSTMWIKCLRLTSPMPLAAQRQR